MDALKKIQAGADKANAKLSAKGFREYTVDLVTPADNDPILGEDGAGTPTLVRLDPNPKCQKATLKYILSAGGALEVGDILVTNITRSEVFAALVLDPKTIWRVKGPDVDGDFSVVGGTISRTNASWRATLRKVQ